MLHGRSLIRKAINSVKRQRRSAALRARSRGLEFQSVGDLIMKYSRRVRCVRLSDCAIRVLSAPGCNRQCRRGIPAVIPEWSNLRRAFMTGSFNFSRSRRDNGGALKDPGFTTEGLVMTPIFRSEPPLCEGVREHAERSFSTVT